MDKERQLTVRGALQNNLKNVTVSASRWACSRGQCVRLGQSALVGDILYTSLEQAPTAPSKLAPQSTSTAWNTWTKVIPRGPISPSVVPRSKTLPTPASTIRKLFTRPAKRKCATTQVDYSFNVKGRCEDCSGDGTLK